MLTPETEVRLPPSNAPRSFSLNRAEFRFSSLQCLLRPFRLWLLVSTSTRMEFPILISVTNSGGAIGMPLSTGIGVLCILGCLEAHYGYSNQGLTGNCLWSTQLT